MELQEMPKYKSHKVVYALKIKEIRTKHVSPSDGSIVIVPEEKGYSPFRVEKDYVEKHNPKVGDYYVVYKDGYKSWSPAEAFEEGYTKVGRKKKKKKEKELKKELNIVKEEISNLQRAIFNLKEVLPGGYIRYKIK